MHHGYYPKGSAPKTNQQAQIDMIEETLSWAGATSAEKVRGEARCCRLPCGRLCCGLILCSCTQFSSTCCCSPYRSHSLFQLHRNPPHTHSQVVDVGCGIGGSSRYLARKFGCTARGITLSPNQAARANQMAAAQGLGDACTFQVAGACGGARCMCVCTGPGRDKAGTSGRGWRMHQAAGGDAGPRGAAPSGWQVRAADALSQTEGSALSLAALPSPTSPSLWCCATLAALLQMRCSSPSQTKSSTLCGAWRAGSTCPVGACRGEGRLSWHRMGTRWVGGSRRLQPRLPALH